MSFHAPRLALLYFLPFFLWPVCGQETFIDDRKLNDQFLEAMESLHDENKLIDRDVFAKALRGATNSQARTTTMRPFKGPLPANVFYKRFLSSVVAVGEFYKCDRCPHWHTSVAGGFPITRDGLFVSNYHVLDSDFEKSAGFGIMTADGKVFPIVEIVAADRLDDLVIFRVDAGTHRFDPLPLTKNPAIGAKVRCISHPRGRFFSFTEGQVSRFNVKYEEDKPIHRMSITAEYAQGSSGSPIMDVKGNVVGVVAETNALTYRRDNKRQDEITQMVVKSAVPVSSIWKLIEGE